MKNIQNKIHTLINLYKSKKMLEAKRLNNELLNQYPNIVILYNVMGLILIAENKLNEAIACYEKAIKIDPNFAEIYDNLGTVYKIKESYNKAESYYKQSIKLNNKIAGSHNNLGTLYKLLNKNDEAIECYNKAISINSKFVIAHYNLGIVYKSIGKFDEARKCLNEAINLDNNFFIAHRTLSQITKYTSSHKHFIMLKKLDQNHYIKKTQTEDLHFALGKAYEDIKDFKSSSISFIKANQIRRSNINFDLKNEEKEFKNIKKVFNKDFFEKYKKSGVLDNTPIFILGMPRSGTTLVEQIISNHPKVYGGDELNFLPNLISKHFDFKKYKNTFADINKKNNIDFKIIAKEYINNLKKISNNSYNVTDKLPINFKWIGFIRILFPNAKIFHCYRNPKDNCLSIFKNYFVNKELNFSYDMNEISNFYIYYLDIMKHWKNLISDSIYEVKYENIIKNSEKEIRNIIENCNLEWNDRCLEFYNNKKTIKTASDFQARSKIYANSVNSWENYKNFFKDLFNNLPK